MPWVRSAFIRRHSETPDVLKAFQPVQHQVYASLAAIRVKWICGASLMIPRHAVEQLANQDPMICNPRCQPVVCPESESCPASITVLVPTCQEKAEFCKVPCVSCFGFQSRVSWRIASDLAHLQVGGDGQGTAVGCFVLAQIPIQTFESNLLVGMPCFARDLYPEQQT